MDNIKEFQSNQIRTVWNDEAGEWYFSVVDVVGALMTAPIQPIILKKRGSVMCFLVTT